MAAETADGEQRSVDGDGRDGGVDAGAIGQAGVDQRRRFIDAAAYAGNDFLDDAQQVGVVFELDGGAIQFAGALDVYEVGSGDQNIADGWILQQGLERSEAEDFVQNFFNDPSFSTRLRGVFSSSTNFATAARISARTRSPAMEDSASRLMRSSNLRCRVNFNSWYSGV